MTNVVSDIAYWNRLAPRFESEVFHVLANDQRRIIAREVARVADPTATAVDLGCGNGRAIPLLARQFARVVGVDLSPALIERARRATRRLPNVELLAADLMTPPPGIPPARLVLSINAILAPDDTIMRTLVRRIADYTAPGGHALVVVPALESMLLAGLVACEWTRRSPSRRARVARRSVLANIGAGAGAGAGAMRVGGTITRHFSRAALTAELAGVGLRVRRLERVEYAWTTEFRDPPRWMRGAYPFDWLAVADQSD